MRITFSNNPITMLRCSISNYILDIKGKRWNKGVYQCRCHVCGDVLDSRKHKFCPEERGWMKLKGKIYDPWICHKCLEHHDSFWIRRENN